MPRSATGLWTNSARQNGFTLLELMVTLTLIGIIATFAVLSVRRSDNEQLATEAQRLTALLELTRQEALLRSEQRGVHFTESGYTLLTLDDKGGWQPPEDSTLLQEYQLPSELHLKLWVDERPVNFKETPADLPQVVLLSSGELSGDFRVVFSYREESYREARAKAYQVSGSLTGELSTGPVP